MEEKKPEINLDLLEAMDDANLGYEITEESATVAESAPIEQELNPDKFKFGPPARMTDESFDDYKARRAAEKIQLKLLHKYGRRQWPASRGTYRKHQLTAKGAGGSIR